MFSLMAYIALYINEKKIVCPMLKVTKKKGSILQLKKIVRRRGKNL
jgi:hypothetical protein